MQTSHLRILENEAIHLMREHAAQFERPGLLFSGGKDSIIMVHLAWKAFYPSHISFPLIHIDTGHNFPETLTFRDNLVEETGTHLIIGSVQESFDNGLVEEETGLEASRHALKTVILLVTVKTHQIDAAISCRRLDKENTPRSVRNPK